MIQTHDMGWKMLKDWRIWRSPWSAGAGAGREGGEVQGWVVRADLSGNIPDMKIFHKNISDRRETPRLAGWPGAVIADLGSLELAPITTLQAPPVSTAWRTLSPPASVSHSTFTAVSYRYAVVVSEGKDWYDSTGVQALCDVEWWQWLSLEQGGKEEEETSWPSLQTGRLPSSHRGLVPSLHSLGRFPPAKGRNLWPLPASRKAERRNREVFMPSQSALNWHWCWVLSIECTLQSTIFSLPSRESTP